MTTLSRHLRAIAVLLLVGAAPALDAHAQASPETATPDRAVRDQADLAVLREAFDIIRRHAVASHDERALVDAAIVGLLREIDPHGDYIDARAYALSKARQEVGGIGIEATLVEGRLKVVSALDGSPAQRAGVRADDIVTHVGRTSLLNRRLDDAVALLRGPVGSTVRLTVVRPGLETPFPVSVTREVVRPRTVFARREGDDVGYIRISGFNVDTATRLEAAIAELTTNPSGAVLRGFVIDLRNNGGGLLDQAVAVADLFLDAGEICSQSGRDPKSIARFQARPGDVTAGKPVIVLIDGGSAAGAEIVAAALQDLRRATVIGTRSAGHGSVQTVIPLGPGQGALRLTTAHVATPGGRALEQTGVTPDIVVAPKRAAGAAGSEPDTVRVLAIDLMRGVRSDPAFPPPARASASP